jgi:hypothetical protein
MAKISYAKEMLLKFLIDTLFSESEIEELEKLSESEQHKAFKERLEDREKW